MVGGWKKSKEGWFVNGLSEGGSRVEEEGGVLCVRVVLPALERGEISFFQNNKFVSQRV